MPEHTAETSEQIPLENLNDLTDESLTAGRDLLRGHRKIEVMFNGNEAHLSFNDDGEESFYLSTHNATIYFTHVERCGMRAYFLRQPGAISATINFEGEYSQFEEVLRFLCE